MGGRGASSDNTQIKKLQSKYDKLKEKNIKLYNEYNGFSLFKINNEKDMQRLNEMNEAHKEWLENRTKLGQLNTRINEEKEKLKKKTQKTITTKSRGRSENEVTSSTYERARRRTKRDVERFLGIK